MPVHCIGYQTTCFGYQLGMGGGETTVGNEDVGGLGVFVVGKEGLSIIRKIFLF